MESRTRASPEQFAALLEFMERHGDISRPQQGPQGRIKADRLWQELEEFLNSMGGGAVRPLIKWKKVWADWKAKTKKKSLAIRREASGTGGGPSSRQTLTASEERVLSLMGLSAVIGQAGVEERGFDAAPSGGNSPHQTDRIYPYQTATGEIILEFIPSNPVQATTACTAPSMLPCSGEMLLHNPSPVQMPPPSIASALLPSAVSAQTSLPSSASAPMPLPSSASAPMPLPSSESAPMPLPSSASAPMLLPSSVSAPMPLPSTASAPMPSVASPTASTSRGVPQRRRRHRESPSPAVTPTTSTPQRRRLHPARSRRIQTPFERATSEFVAVENRRLQIEADRNKEFHERETERLRLEAKRLELEEQKIQILSRLGGAVDNLIEMIQLRPSSLPSTDIIP